VAVIVGDAVRVGVCDGVIVGVVLAVIVGVAVAVGDGVIGIPLHCSIQEDIPLRQDQEFLAGQLKRVMLFQQLYWDCY